jgi:hypothetical protein
MFSDTHCKLIEMIIKEEDIKEKVIQHIDFEEWANQIERKRMIRDTVYNKRWKRKNNHYDSLKYDELGR